jgi:acetyl esterase/lipase
MMSEETGFSRKSLGLKKLPLEVKFEVPTDLPPMMNVDHIKRKWLDIPYASQSLAQRMDIYIPEKGSGPFPVIVAIHGGAWMICDKRDVQQLPMLQGLNRGYAVVSINYRLSHEAKFPAQIFDCKAAIRFIRANAEKYSIDPDRIIAWGGSAGGHLSALLGTSAGVSELEDLSMGNAEYSSEVQLVVDWFGPTEDFLKMDEELSASKNGVPDHSQPNSPESLLLGKMITEAPELVKFASPMTYIHKDIPAFLIQHGSLDQLVPVEQSINFAKKIEEIAGKEKVILEILNGSIHADPAFESKENVERVFKFIDEHFM